MASQVRLTHDKLVERRRRKAVPTRFPNSASTYSRPMLSGALHNPPLAMASASSRPVRGLGPRSGSVQMIFSEKLKRHPFIADCAIVSAVTAEMAELPESLDWSGQVADMRNGLARYTAVCIFATSYLLSTSG